MKNKLWLLPLLAVFVLVSCDKPGTTSQDDSASDSSPVSSTSATPIPSTDEEEYIESAVWPASAISAFINGASASIVPSFNSPNPFYYGEFEYEYGPYFEIYTEIDANKSGLYFDVEVTYNTALTNAGFVIDDTYDYDEVGFVAYSVDDDIVVQYYWWDGYFTWFISLL